MKNKDAYSQRLLKELERILNNEAIPQEVKQSLLAEPEIRKLIAVYGGEHVSE